MRSTEIEVWKSQTSGEMELVGNGVFFFLCTKKRLGIRALTTLSVTLLVSGGQRI